jgi:hypothetical protein
MVGIRVTPDNNDIVVWKLDDAAAPFINSSTSGSAPSHAVSDLATLSGTGAGAPRLQQPSPFAGTGSNTAVLFSGNNAGSPRNYILGANNVEPQAPVTFSFWMYMRIYANGLTQHFFAKQHTAGVWSGVFAQIELQNRTHVSQSTAFDLFAVTATGGGMILDASNNIPLNVWCHIGLVYDGAFQYGYLNGNLVGQTAATGSIVYGNHGPWFFGGPLGSGSVEEGAYSICDFRIANVARPQSYFQDVYRKAIMPLTNGNPIVTYYKLRAYDTSCSTPTPVYWVSTSVNYNDAPAAPCGSLGPIEIMDTWTSIGL